VVLEKGCVFADSIYGKRNCSQETFLKISCKTPLFVAGKIIPSFKIKIFLNLFYGCVVIYRLSAIAGLPLKTTIS
jgi:hypothetical protein